MTLRKRCTIRGRVVAHLRDPLEGYVNVAERGNHELELLKLLFDGACFTTSIQW